MKRYITDSEVYDLLQAPSGSLQQILYERMYSRVQGYIQVDGFRQEQELQQEWYHLVWGKLSEASFIYRVTRNKDVRTWLHDRVMELVGLEEDAWIGPWFRPRKSGLPVGALETAKIALALCEVCLNAPEALSEPELELVYKVMEEKALVLLERHTDKLFSGESCTKNNWFMVTNCAYGMTAAVLGQEKKVQHACRVLKETLGFWDQDSYGEPLNYAEMASTYIWQLCEAWYRLGYMTEEELPLGVLARMIGWYVSEIQGVQYAQEEEAWIPKAFNFGDTNLHMYFQSDKLVQMAVRLKERDPKTAGLASWLFDLPYKTSEHGDIRYKDDFYGLTYLGLLALPEMAAPISPKQAKLPLVNRFQVGHILARDDWERPRLTLAIAAGGEAMQVSSHKHPDQNSFQVTVGKERMLIDPGMCCYRLDSQQASKDQASHSGIMLYRQGNPLQQYPVSGCKTDDAGKRLNHLLVYEQFEDSWVIVSDAACLYDGVEKAVRVWVFCMPGMMFVADYVVSGEAMQLHTNFVMNNEDNRLKTNVYNSHRLVFRRGAEAMKLFQVVNLVDGREAETELVYDWSYAHHRYGIQPNSSGQAKEGSALVYRWKCKEEGTRMHRLHALMMDEEKYIKYWHLRQADGFYRLEAPKHEDTLDFRFTEDGFAVRRNGHTGQWSLT